MPKSLTRECFQGPDALTEHKSKVELSVPNTNGLFRRKRVKLTCRSGSNSGRIVQLRTSDRCDLCRGISGLSMRIANSWLIMYVNPSTSILLCRVVVSVTTKHDTACSLQAYMRLPVSQYVLIDVGSLPYALRCSQFRLILVLCLPKTSPSIHATILTLCRCPWVAH